MPQLPVKLWASIFQILSSKCRPNEDSNATANLICVSRTLYDLGIPYLYRQCIPQTQQHARECFTTLLKNDTAAKSVLHLSIPNDIEHGDVAEFSMTLPRVLERLDNLISLRLPRSFPELDDIALQNPERLPFRLESFHTSIDSEQTGTLMTFLSHQSTIRTFVWGNARVLSGSPAKIPPHEITSLALMRMWPSVFKSLTLPSISHFAFSFYRYQLYQHSFTPDEFRLWLDWTCLKSLSCLGGHNEACALLGAVAPMLENLTHLYLKEAILTDLITIIESIPCLEVVVLQPKLSDDFESPELNEQGALHLALGLPKSIHVYLYHIGGFFLHVHQDRVERVEDIPHPPGFCVQFNNAEFDPVSEFCI